MFHVKHDLYTSKEQKRNKTKYSIDKKSINNVKTEDYEQQNFNG